MEAAEVGQLLPRQTELGKTGSMAEAHFASPVRHNQIIQTFGLIGLLELSQYTRSPIQLMSIGQLPHRSGGPRDRPGLRRKRQCPQTPRPRAATCGAPRTPLRLGNRESRKKERGKEIGEGGREKKGEMVEMEKWRKEGKFVEVLGSCRHFSATRLLTKAAPLHLTFGS